MVEEGSESFQEMREQGRMLETYSDCFPRSKSSENDGTYCYESHCSILLAQVIYRFSSPELRNESWRARSPTRRPNWCAQAPLSQTSPHYWGGRSTKLNLRLHCII